MNVKRIIIPLPSRDFDPTEVAVPWRILKQRGFEIQFATPEGERASADPLMVSGEGLGIFRSTMRAAGDARAAYAELLGAEEFLRPARYEQITVQGFEGLILPGGHAPGMRPYLESPVLQALVADSFARGKPVGAICHGVVLAARSRRDERSVLYGRKTTALPQWMELLAWGLTCTWLGSYYRTYPLTVQAEVTAALKAPEDFLAGPVSLKRDTIHRQDLGFVVRDGNYVSARWPGDAHRFAYAFADLFDEDASP